MKKIASFQVNHDLLEKGMYVSRTDGDVITYDIRMKKPNNSGNDYISPAGGHTLEHLIATWMRNSKYSDKIIYIGPMGCQTGFYFLTRNLSHENAIALVQECFAYISNFKGEIPGSKRIECGQYLLHNLSEAKAIALDMCEILKNWTPEKLIYSNI